MNWAEALTVIMLSCGHEDHTCQQKLVACVSKMDPVGEHDMRLAVVHCVQLPRDRR